MQARVTIDWMLVVELLIELIKLLAPLFTNKEARHRIERAMDSLDAIREAGTTDPLHRVFCAVLQPAVDDKTKAAIDTLDEAMPEAIDWEKVLETFVAFLKFLLELFAPDDDDEPDDPPDDLVNYTVITARATVTREQLDRHAEILSGILDELHIATDDALATDTTLLREVARDQITTALALDASHWEDFSAAMDAALDRLADKGVLKTIFDYDRAYRDIAKGLKQA